MTLTNGLYALLEPPLAAIADMLPGYKVTLICRHAEKDNAEIIIGDDDTTEAMKALMKAL